MKALILNSGIGSRMGDIAPCKCLVEIADGVTILDTQIKALLNCDIKDLYITTGHNADVLESYIKSRYPNEQITLIHNPLFNQTNYIYSIQLARDFIGDEDILLLHGDLIFEQNVLFDLLASDKSVMVIDSTLPLPEKDFKAVVTGGRVKHVGIETLTESVYAQPMYKLLQKDWNLWLDEIDRFCKLGNTNVYAENAFNEVSDSIELYPLDVTGRKCFEIDNPDDLAFGKKAYENMPDRLQTTYFGYGAARRLPDILTSLSVKKLFVVCDKGVSNPLWVAQEPKNTRPLDTVLFDAFKPNPDVNDVMDGIALFEKSGCDFIISIGGGSAIDVAKGIKMLDLCQAPRARSLAIPTTAGTGSESTCFAVLYKDGEKLSVEHKNIMPEYVILDADFLASLPVYQKKCALLDALCQGIESMWAKGKTDESKAYAKSAINAIYENTDGYLAGEQGYAQRMLQAANLAGKAINIGKTTAAHAMSYGISGMFGLPHGHAVALCMTPVWAHLIESDFIIDDLTENDFKQFIDFYNKLMTEEPSPCPNKFGTQEPSPCPISELTKAVNLERLGNHPVVLSDDILSAMYGSILI